MVSVETVMALVFLTVFGFWMGRRRAASLRASSAERFHSLPGHHGGYVALWCGIPAGLVLLAGWMSRGALAHLLAQNPALIQASLLVAVIAASLAGFAFSYRRIGPALKARPRVEAAIRAFLALSSLVAILTTIGIVASLVFEAFRFFQTISPIDFLFGLTWSPQIALRADQVGSSGLFGAVPLFTATLMVGAIAMAIAVPVGLLSAIYMSEYASARTRAIVKPLLEILAGVPTVVYGFFAALTIGPGLRFLGDVLLGASWPAESAMAAGRTT